MLVASFFRPRDLRRDGLPGRYDSLRRVRQSVARPVDPAQLLERTSFQTGAPWDPMLQLPADVAMCYGVGKDLGRRINLWKDHGYIVHVMTGVAWGNYQDYLYGKFDGKRHVNEAQTDRWGNVISHGGDVYYMCPGPTFGDYLAQRVLAAIEAGAQAIHLEEPEFWSRAGYSEGFKRACAQPTAKIGSRLILRRMPSTAPRV